MCGDLRCVLQCVAVCCSVLHCVSVCFGDFRLLVWRLALLCGDIVVAAYCTRSRSLACAVSCAYMRSDLRCVLQCVAVCCGDLRLLVWCLALCVAMCCSVVSVLRRLAPTCVATCAAVRRHGCRRMLHMHALSCLCGDLCSACAATLIAEYTPA